MSHHVCAGNCTRVLFGSSRCSQLLSCLSGPMLTVYSFRTTVLLHCACCSLTPSSSLLLPPCGSISSCPAPRPSLLIELPFHSHTHPVRLFFFSHSKNSHSIKAQAASESSVACHYCVLSSLPPLWYKDMARAGEMTERQFSSLGHREELPRCLSLLS